MLLLAALSIVWTWPLALHFGDHIPGTRRRQLQLPLESVVDAEGAELARARFLSVDVSVQPLRRRPDQSSAHRASGIHLGDCARRTVDRSQAENLYIIMSVFLNAVCAYALAFDIVRAQRRLGAPRRRCVRRLAVCRGAPARTFRSVDGVGHPAVRACVFDDRCGTAASQRPSAAASASPWRRTPRTTTSYISLSSLSPTRSHRGMCSACAASRARQTQALFTVRLVLIGADGARCVSHHRHCDFRRRAHQRLAEWRSPRAACRTRCWCSGCSRSRGC